jgi:glycerophosphoryl diester phosphodiesterase
MKRMKTLALSICLALLAAHITACSDDDKGKVPVTLRIASLSQAKVIAHRGYWNTSGAAENSLAALEKAAEAGFYGSEFDVRMTLDGTPVICHDESIHGLLIEDTPYEGIGNFKLSNGETMPTLQQYLETGKKLNIQLILELKPYNRIDNLKAAETVVSMVKDMGMEKQVEYISISLPVCSEIIRLSPQSSVSYLSGVSHLSNALSPAKLKELGLTGIDYQDHLLRIRPEWIREAKNLGMKVNVWTVNDTEAMYSFIMLGVDFITTDRPEVLQNMLTNQ